MKFDLSDFVANAEDSIIDCLKLINLNEHGIVFVCQSEKFLGSVTDGDIRRALIEGLSTDICIGEIVNKNAKRVTIGASPIEIHKLLGTGIKLLPVLDLDGRIIEVISNFSTNSIPLSEPTLTGNELEYVTDAVKSGWISSAGNYVTKFETLFETFTGAHHALTVSNGTQALVLALHALSISSGDEVIVPALTFGATANAVIQVGAKPIFADVHYQDFSINVSEAAKLVTSRTKAIIPVHLYGRSANLTSVWELAKKFDLRVIEDCAEAIGTKHLGKHVGTESDAGTFSFYGNKTISTGEGGMLTFRDSDVFQKARLIRSHGFSPERRYWHLVWGTNMRLTNLQSAIGVAQMEQLPELLLRRQELSDEYTRILASSKISNLIEKNASEFSKDSPWLFILHLNQDNLVGPLEANLKLMGIESRRVFLPLPGQPAFNSYAVEGATYPNSLAVYNRALCLPLFAHLAINDVAKVCDAVISFLEA
jgi:perosamine synthetase